MGTYSSQAHFRAVMENTFGSLKFTKEVIKRANKAGEGNTPLFFHRVHARCEYAGTSRVKANKRARTRESKMVDSCCTVRCELACIHAC